MIICLGATPALQRVMVFDRLQLGAVNRARTTLDGIAGKSVNVAKVLRSLGCQVTALGFSGGTTGKLLVSELRHRGIMAEFLQIKSGTRQCTTVVDVTHGTHTELVEESQPLPASNYTDLLEVLARHLPNCRALVLSGTATPGAPPDFYARCVRLAKSHNVLSVVDAKGELLALALQEGPNVAKPNVSELAVTVGKHLQTESDVIQAVRGLCSAPGKEGILNKDRRSHETGLTAETENRGIDRKGVAANTKTKRVAGKQHFVVTAGPNAAIAWDGYRFWRIHPPVIQVQNPIGSGDAFTAALTWKLLEGADLGESCRWGAAAGGANALSLMPGELDPGAVHRLLNETKVELLPY